MDYTVTALLSAVRLRGGFPSAAALGTSDANLVRLANEELRLRLYADVLKCREAFYLVSKDSTMTAGLALYPVNRRAMGGVLQKVEILDVSGNNPRKLERIEAEQAEEYTPENQGTPVAFYFKSNNIVLVPTPSSAATLRQSFFIRPPELLTVSSALRLVSTVVADSPTTGTTRITTTAPHSFTTSSVLDFTSDITGEVTDFDVTPTAVGASTMDFTSTALHPGISTALNAGFYVGGYGTSFTPYLPLEWHPVLYGRIVSTILKGMGRIKELMANEAQLQLETDAAVSLVTPRAQGNSKIVSNAYGILTPVG